MRSLTGQCLARTDNHLPNGKSNLQSMKARRLRLMHADKVMLVTAVTRVVVAIVTIVVRATTVTTETIATIAVRAMIATTVMTGAFNGISTIKMAATAIAIVDAVEDLVVFETHATKAHKVIIAMS